MPPPADFARSVFINLPEGKAHEPLLQAMAFCVIYLGFTPRVAAGNGGAARLAQVQAMAEGSKYSIHDLTGCRTGAQSGLDVPVELAIDYGCRQFKGAGWGDKSLLIFAQRPRRAGLAGCEFQSHGGDYQRAVRKVMGWLAEVAGAERAAPALVHSQAYPAFQEWHYERQLEAGCPEADIQGYPTGLLLGAMAEWIGLGGG